MPPKPKLNVHSFPRPPLLEKTPRHLLITRKSSSNNNNNNDATTTTIADTRNAYWVLETTHPPTYYLLRDSITAELHRTSHTSFCEWKGRATYYSVALQGQGGGGGGGGDVIPGSKNKAWSYEDPTSSFIPLKGYVSFYADDSLWDCYVDGEKVEAQDGDFYGGWVTSELEGRMKGGPGTWGW